MRRVHDNWVGAFYVLPEYQAHGLGSQMMRSALEWLGSDKPVTVAVAAYNDNAMKFYRGFGFKPGKRIEEDPSEQPPGAVIPEIEMVRPAS
jgi:GNAT superfamily N-acetyltransferase